MARASLSNLSTFLTKLKSIFSLIGHTHSQYVQNTTYNNKMSSLDSSVSTLSNGKVAKSGDTMSGTLRFSTGSCVFRDVDNSVTQIGGGKDSYSPMLQLYGKDHSSYSGRAYLYGKNATQNAYIMISPDGTTSAPTPSVTDSSTKIATTAFVKAQDCSMVKYYNIANETADKTLLSVAETYLATTAHEIIYAAIASPYDTGSSTTRTPFTYGIATIYHRNDTIFIIGYAYSNGIIFTNSRSRGGTWLGWKKATMTSV